MWGPSSGGEWATAAIDLNCCLVRIVYLYGVPTMKTIKCKHCCILYASLVSLKTFALMPISELHKNSIKASKWIAQEYTRNE